MAKTQSSCYSFCSVITAVILL